MIARTEAISGSVLGSALQTERSRLWTPWRYVDPGKWRTIV